MQFELSLQSCQNKTQLKSIFERYERFDNPHICYRVGETYLVIFNNKSEALPYFLSGACYGFDTGNSFYLNHLSNSIGHCYYYLLDKYSFDFIDQSYEYNLCCLTYIYLSQCIKLIGIQANDSLRTRALLIDYFRKRNTIKRFLHDYYYNGDDLCTEILSVYDYYYSSLAFKNNGDINESNRCYSWAQKNMETILSLSQYKDLSILDLDAISEISKQNHNYLFKKVEPDFPDKKFSYSPESFKTDLISNLF